MSSSEVRPLRCFRLSDRLFKDTRNSVRACSNETSLTFPKYTGSPPDAVNQYVDFPTRFFRSFAVRGTVSPPMKRVIEKGNAQRTQYSYILQTIKIRTYNIGEVAEWSNAPVLKTGRSGNRSRGFESRPLRFSSCNRSFSLLFQHFLESPSLSSSSLDTALK